MSRLKLTLFFLFLFSLSSISNAASVDFTPLVGVTAITVVIFLALTNMLGSAISSPQMSAWVKTEIRELIAAVILIFILYTFFIGSRGITNAITGKGDYLIAAENVINGILTDPMYGYDRSMYDIMRSATRIRAAATYSPYMSIPLWYVGLTYSTSPLSGAGILFSSLAAATQGLATSIFLYEAVLLLIKFSYTAVPKVLLPIALCLRLIPFTRKGGNTLIAICLAAMVLLPFSVILIGEMHKVITYPKAYLTSGQLDNLDPGTWAMTVAEPLCQLMPIRVLLSLNDLLFSLVVCAPLLLIPIAGPGLYAACQPLVQNVVYPIIMIVMQVAYDLALLGWIAFSGEGKGYAADAFNVLYPFLGNVNNVVLLGYLDAIIMAVITISGARSISSALGGEWYLSGIQRLV